ncbi:MAG: hypothetical protein ACRDT8_16965, partial [Micromonosporaceae bacterium]
RSRLTAACRGLWRAVWLCTFAEDVFAGYWRSHEYSHWQTERLWEAERWSSNHSERAQRNRPDQVQIPVEVFSRLTGKMRGLLSLEQRGIPSNLVAVIPD